MFGRVLNTPPNYLQKILLDRFDNLHADKLACKAENKATFFGWRNSGMM